MICMTNHKNWLWTVVQGGNYVSNGCGPDAKSVFPPVSVVEGMESVPSVCVSVYALMAEPFDIRFQNMVEALTLISWMSSKVNVIGQRSRSPG